MLPLMPCRCNLLLLLVGWLNFALVPLDLKANTPMNDLRPGTFDSSFQPGPQLVGRASSMVVQSDGKLLLGGILFTGVPPTRNAWAIVRLSSDGILDESFLATSLTYSMVDELCLQADGKVLATVNLDGHSNSPEKLIRLNDDGSPDGTFAQGQTSDGSIATIVADSSGRILIGGAFKRFAGRAAPGLVRLRADGVIDEGFAARILEGSINSISVDHEGRIVLGGYNLKLPGLSGWNIGRLHEDGTVDIDFNPTLILSQVCRTALLTDGSVLVGGFGGFAKLRSDGTTDPSFTARLTGSGLGLAVQDFIVQPDGRLIIGGRFSAVDSERRHGLARLLPSGKLDPDFDSGRGLVDPNTVVLALLPSGHVAVAGHLYLVNGRLPGSVARFHAFRPCLLSFADLELKRCVVETELSWPYRLLRSQDLKEWIVERSFVGTGVGVMHDVDYSADGRPTYFRVVSP